MDNGNLKILVVEDHEDTAKMIRILLARSGYKAVVVGSVIDALRAAQNTRFDVVLCDVGLPDGDGCELLQSILKLYPIKSVAVTGFAYESDHKRASSAGFDHWITKPYEFGTIDALLSTIAAALPATISVKTTGTYP